MIRGLPFAVAVIVYAVTCASLSTAAEAPTQAEIEQWIIGKWFLETTDDGFSFKTTTTYRKDGTLSGQSVIVRGGRTLNLTFSGTWKAKGSTVIESIEKSDPPTELVGIREEDVSEINEKTYRYRDGQGKERLRTRLSE